MFAVLMVGLFSSVIYANDIKENNISVNVKEVPGENEDTQILVSEDGYIQITQINQNSQKVKIYTLTFDGKVSLMGKAKKGTKIDISIYNKKITSTEYADEAKDTYSIEVGSTADFNQLLELLEGDNKIKLYYTNKSDGTDDVMVFYIRRESTQSKEALKNYLVIPSSK